MDSNHFINQKRTEFIFLKYTINHYTNLDPIEK